MIAAELTRPAPKGATRFAEEVRRRHGGGVAAVLFYGSCLRTGQMDGVLDFYVLVDSYRAVFTSPVLAWLSALLPPSVFYAEISDGGNTLRAKYAVISTADFVHAVSLRSVHSGVWARFCQPSLLAYARDDAARAVVVGAVAEAVLTVVTRAVGWAADGDEGRLHPATLWQRGFQETYAAEWRPERAETIRQIYHAAPTRYDRLAAAALHELENRGVLRFRAGQGNFTVTLPATRRRQLLWNWRLRRPLVKGLYALRLLKTAATFGDWLPYVLWKLERHTGVRVELTERQRRRPLIWGWPVLAKLLRQRTLR